MLYFSLCCVYQCTTMMRTFLFFFFKQKTAYEMRISDWSSDVCSSDLGKHERGCFGVRRPGSAFGMPLAFECRGSSPCATGRDTKEIGRASCRERVCQYV